MRRKTKSRKVAPLDTTPIETASLEKSQSQIGLNDSDRGRSMTVSELDHTKLYDVTPMTTEEGGPPKDPQEGNTVGIEPQFSTDNNMLMKMLRNKNLGSTKEYMQEKSGGAVDYRNEHISGEFPMVISIDVQDENNKNGISESNEATEINRSQKKDDKHYIPSSRSRESLESHPGVIVIPSYVQEPTIHIHMSQTGRFTQKMRKPSRF